MNKNRFLNIGLWVAQTVVAVFFLGLGFMKLFQPDKLPFPWINENHGLASITGIIDILGSLGLVLPTLLSIRPKLTIFAAYSSIVYMIAASIFHISRGEADAIGFNIFVILILIFIVWGRQKSNYIQS